MSLVLAIASLAVPSARAADTFGDFIYYYGDPHAHTGYSGDGASSDVGRCEAGTCGSFATVFDDARAEGLDWVVISDHINGIRTMTEAQFLTWNAAVLAGHDPDNGFVTVPGGELWFYANTSPLGHQTLMMFEDNDTLSALTLNDVRPTSASRIASCESLWTWADDLAAAWGDVFLIPHHPATADPIGTNWSCHDETYQPVTEIYSRHGNSLEPDSGWDVPYMGVTASGYTTVGLSPTNDLHFGFIGGTDGHDTHPGETCALDAEQPRHVYGGGLTVLVLDPSEAFDRPAIHDAMVAHHTYTTTGPMMPLAIEWSSDGDDLGGLGDDFEVSDTEDLEVVVSMETDDALYVDSVELVSYTDRWTLTDEGDGTWTGTIPAADLPDWVYVDVTLDGDAYYGTGVCTDGGSDSTEHLWSSPSFITIIDLDADDDGVEDDLDCDAADATVYPGATETWYDGIDEDCDGASDFDQDGDGFEAAEEAGDDCDDLDADVNPDAEETWYDGVDANCDGSSDYDADYDGYEAAFAYGEDCDDDDAAVYPAADDLDADGLDQDCDGADGPTTSLAHGSTPSEEATVDADVAPATDDTGAAPLDAVEPDPDTAAPAAEEPASEQPASEEPAAEEPAAEEPAGDTASDSDSEDTGVATTTGSFTSSSSTVSTRPAGHRPPRPRLLPDGRKPRLRPRP